MLEKKGIVQTIEAQHLKVELTSREGPICIPWDTAQKQYKIGEFIQVSHGPHQGCCGWVVTTSDHKINCTKELPLPPGIGGLEIVPWIEIRITVH